MHMCSSPWPNMGNVIQCIWLCNPDHVQTCKSPLLQVLTLWQSSYTYIRTYIYVPGTLCKLWFDYYLWKTLHAWRLRAWTWTTRMPKLRTLSLYTFTWSVHAPLMHVCMYVPTYLNQLISLTNTQQARSAVVEEVLAHNRDQDIFSRLGKFNLQ